jgi:2,4-dienoyl-CoA reductase (NADPH2)
MSGGGQYKRLFTPLRVGPLTIDNRIVFSAHLTNYATEDGLPSDQHTAYYAARAAGGAGLIITEEHSTHPTDWPYEKLIHGFHPEVIGGYRRITEAVHAHGVPILAQINHNGGQASSMYTRLPVWAPSPVPDPLFREVPKAVEPHEIAEIVAGYALVADHCMLGGFDGVELQCSHSSIVRGFLSPATNRRTDGYGGSLPQRARLLFEIVAAVREVIGPDRVLGVRLCGDELIEGGTIIEDAVEVARLLEAGGRVDYINTSIGVATATLYMIEASMQIPPGYAMFIPSAIREAVSLPVVGVGRFKDPLQADRALQAGYCDLVGVVRGQIADADFAAKARTGRAAEIRTCLSCNQECVGRMGLNRWLGCIENPRTGREAVMEEGPAAGLGEEAGGAGWAGGRFEHGSGAFDAGSDPGVKPVPALRPSGLGALFMKKPQKARPIRTPSGRRVVIAGGGPAGLQAAVTATEGGHRVVVFERLPRLGGQVPVAASVPSRAEFLDITRNLVAQAQRLGVDIRAGVEADAGLIRAAQPDVVILATGARPARPWWADDHPRVVDVRDVLEGRAAPAGRVVIVDELGFHQATSVAEVLADRGCEVEIATNGMVVGQDLGITLDLETWNVRAHAKGIRQATDLVPLGIAEGDPAEGGALVLHLQHHPTGEDRNRVCDWVVCSVHQQPDDYLWPELRGSEFPVYRIGDCLAPRRAQAAVIEGHRVAAAL